MSWIMTRRYAWPILVALVIFAGSECCRESGLH